MLTLNYTATERLDKSGIASFIQSLQLNFFVKEYNEINEYISLFMLNTPPAANQTIRVTSPDDPPHGLEGVKGKFNALIVYDSTEGMNDRQFPCERRIGDHYIHAGFDCEKQNWWISIEMNALQDGKIPSPDSRINIEKA